MTRPDFTITADDARALAEAARVCGRPMLRRVESSRVPCRSFLSWKG